MRPEYALGFAKLDNPGMLLWRKSPEPAMRGKSDLQESAALAAIAEAPPHYHGHRKRLRARFRQAGAQGLAEYELLELVLFRALPRRDVKPIAKKLLEKFGSFAEVISAPPARLAEISGLGEEAITDLKIVQAAANEFLRSGLRQKPVLSSWAAVLDYCRTAMRTRTRRSCVCSFSTSATS